MQNYSADVTGIFEIVGDRGVAMNYILEKLEDKKRGVRILEIEVVRWSDPYSNEPVKIRREFSTNEYSKYTFTVQLQFSNDGGYPEAQEWLANRLNEDEKSTHMNIQAIRLLNVTQLRPTDA